MGIMENFEECTVDSDSLAELAHECHQLLDKFLAVPPWYRSPVFHTKVVTYHIVEDELQGLYTRQIPYPKRELLD